MNHFYFVSCICTAGYLKMTQLISIQKTQNARVLYFLVVVLSKHTTVICVTELSFANSQAITISYLFLYLHTYMTDKNKLFYDSRMK
jgi:hypothetical protein